MSEIFKCKKCGIEADTTLLSELKEMGEAFWFEKETDYYICPDCWANFNRKSAEEQFDELMNE